MIAPESTLISLVQETKNSEALTELVNRHTGIYYTVVNKYASVYPNLIKIDDMNDDRLYHMYRFILDYKNDKNMQLSSYIGERTNYMCLDILKKENKNPINYNISHTIGDPGPVEIYTTDFAVSVVDETQLAQTIDSSDKDLALEDIISIAKNNDIDPRFVSILNYRHLNPDKKSLSWRQIGKKLGISYERARKIYFKNINKIKREMGEKICN